MLWADLATGQYGSDVMQWHRHQNIHFVLEDMNILDSFVDNLEIFTI